MAKKDDKFDFEKALGELETLVEKMETGDMSLEESLKQFERGVALTRSCQQALAEIGDCLVVVLDRFEPVSEIRALLPHVVVDQVFPRMMHGVRVHVHVAHDVLHALKVGRVVLMGDMIDLFLKKIQQDSHVAVILTELGENPGSVF